MKNIKSQLLETEVYCDIVMQSIADILDGHNIKYKINNMTEIEVERVDKAALIDIIKSEIDIKWCLFKMLIDISEVDSIVYIRQKIK